MKKNLAYDLFITDMDDTLLNQNSEVTRQTIEGIKKYIGAGGRFTVASGRNLHSIAMYPELFKLINGPMVLLNGSLVYDPKEKKVLFERFLPKEAKEVLALIQRSFPQLGILVFPKEGPVLKISSHKMSEIIVKREGHPGHIVLLDQIPLPWYKFVLGGPEEVIKKANAILLKELQDCPAYNTVPGYSEVVAQGISKGFGISFMTDSLGLDLSRVAAMGDGLNDIEMIQTAGLGLAIGNAQTKLKEKADLVCPWTNAEEGVFHVCNLLSQGMDDDQIKNHFRFVMKNKFEMAKQI